MRVTRFQLVSILSLAIIVLVLLLTVFSPNSTNIHNSVQQEQGDITLLEIKLLIQTGTTLL